MFNDADTGGRAAKGCSSISAQSTPGSIDTELWLRWIGDGERERERRAADETADWLRMGTKVMALLSTNTLAFDPGKKVK